MLDFESLEWNGSELPNGIMLQVGTYKGEPKAFRVRLTEQMPSFEAIQKLTKAKFNKSITISEQSTKYIGYDYWRVVRITSWLTMRS